MLGVGKGSQSRPSDVCSGNFGAAALRQVRGPCLPLDGCLPRQAHGGPVGSCLAQLGSGDPHTSRQGWQWC